MGTTQHKIGSFWRPFQRLLVNNEETKANTTKATNHQEHVIL